MKYFIVAGERSGDLHASKLIRQIKRLDVRAEVVGYGGDLMEKEGATILQHYSSFSVMGFVEVITKLNRIRRLLSNCRKAIKQTRPDVLILVDFPGVNLKLATFAKKIGIRTCYYISPKVWAWKEYRIKRIRRDVDKMLVILPFEVDYYKEKGLKVEYIGNPLIDSIRDYEFDPTFSLPDSGAHIAVLPGSRKQEIKASARVVEEIAATASSFRFIVAGVDNVPSDLYAPYKAIPNVQVLFNKTYEILKKANAAIVTSGTATLETALLNCPQVVVYRANPISIFIVKALVKIKWISLVNLIAQKGVVKELIQEAYNAKDVLQEINLLLNDHHYCAGMMHDYQELRDRIGAEPASKKAAGVITDWLESEIEG